MTKAQGTWRAAGLAALRTTSIVLAAAIAGGAIATARGDAAPAGPPRVLFNQGYNLCRAAPLKALRKAGGQPYKAGLFINRSCLWQRPDLIAGVTLATHPPRVGAVLMRNFLSQNGKGLEARKIAVPGASKAVLVTLPAGAEQVSKDLFAAYKRGAIQVNMTAPGSLPDKRLIAVVRLIART